MLKKIRLGNYQSDLNNRILSGEYVPTKLSKKELQELEYKAKYYLKYGKYPPKKKIKMKKIKLGKLVLSATSLRKMANYLQKQYKTKGDILIDCSIVTYNKEKTFGYETKTGKILKRK